MTTAIAFLSTGQTHHPAPNSDQGHRKCDSGYPAPAARWSPASIWASPAYFNWEAGTRVRAIEVDWVRSSHAPFAPGVTRPK